MLLLLDLDLLFFVVVVLLASKSSPGPVALPRAVTLRLGSVIKASPVPNVRCVTKHKRLGAKSGPLASKILRFCKENRRICCVAHYPSIQNPPLS